MGKKAKQTLKDVLQMHYNSVGISVVNSVADLQELVLKNPDLAFIGVKKIPAISEDSDDDGFVWVSRYLEDKGITTTGSDSENMKIERDKTKAKDIVRIAGLATSPYFTAEVGEYAHESQLPLGFPLFLKPYDQGAGVGVDDSSVVRNFNEFESKLSSLLSENYSKVLVEEYLDGREFTVAVMMDSSRENLMVMPLEQLPLKNSHGDCIIGHDMKKSETETPVALVEEGALRQAIIGLARNAFIAIGARDYGRIDIRLDKHGVPNFLEANLIPALIDGSGNFQKACQMNLGMTHEQMILHIVDLAFGREERILEPLKIPQSTSI